MKGCNIQQDQILWQSQFYLMALMLLLLSLITSSLVANSKWAVIELKDNGGGDGGEVEEDQVDLGGDGRLAQDQNIHEKEGDVAAGDRNHNDYTFSDDSNSFFHVRTP